MDKISDILNDLMTEISIAQSYTECIEIVTKFYDDNGGTNTPEGLAHINHMNAMTGGLTERFNLLEKLASDAWDAIMPKIKYLQDKLDEAKKQRDYYKDLAEKQWVKVDDYSRDVAAQILQVIANPPGGVLTVDVLNELYEKYARKEAEVKP